MLAAVFGLAWGGEGAPAPKGAEPPAPKAPEPKAPEPKAPEPKELAPAIEVTELKLAYPAADLAKHKMYEKHTGLPKLEEALQLQVKLGKTAEGYVAARAGVEAVAFVLAELPKQPLKKFFPSAILSIEEQIVKWFNQRGIVGVFVATHPDDVTVTFRRRKYPEAGSEFAGWDDNRGTRKDLRLVVWVGMVTRVRTIASGTRVPPDKRVDNPLNARIKAHSPVQPATNGAAARSDLLDQEALERYTFFLSRHPGRRVDVALSSDDKPGGVVLDYLVTENRPWYAYAQISNTGTAFTRRWRERFGFVHNQLTGRDDILTLDYSTAGFDAAHAVALSYEMPVFHFDRLRWRTYAQWSRYTASDVGIANAEFVGKGWSVGTELIFNFFQRRAFFLDAVAGARVQHERVEDKLLDQVGEDTLLVPYVGLRLQRVTEVASTFGSAFLEWNHANWIGTHKGQLERLGRENPDLHFHVLRYDLSHSFYVEPFLDPAAWEAPGSRSWWRSTLAHELFFAIRGQHSMGDRLIPQNQMVIGGAYTVRGYPESVVIGDSAWVATAEYRFHFPRILKPLALLERRAPEDPKTGARQVGIHAAETKLTEPTKPAKFPLLGGPFRFAPQDVYVRPDWDLIFRLFFDVGRVTHEHNEVFEVDRTIRGCGAGAELRIRDNFSIRCDYGVALDDIEDPATGDKTWRRGNHRFHTICTLAF
ncbi:MAG: ShlB/FhaC/HecB family hemolysin secretion/activation protein [Planctomycetes bacterium]|nr:ShlB/FhaC/HecB family hemolysin secretion/activation protein [Planctomycetota bacterium]